MKRGRKAIFPVLLCCMAAIAACRPEPDLPLAERLVQPPAGFPPIPFPADNAFTEARWQLGKKIFHDPILSIDSSISCASCHKIQHALADENALSPGVFGRPGKTNAPSLANVAYHPYFLREGGVPTLEMQVLVPIQEDNEFAHNIVAIADQMAGVPEYVAMSQAAYGRDPDAFVITRALSTYERTLLSGNSPFDQYYYQGKRNALNTAERRGFNLFSSPKAGCTHCHDGFNFTDYSFQNTGLYLQYDNIGRMRHTGDSADLALFKVPSLRNVGLTPPYMHNGSISTLAQVIEHYNGGGEAHPHKSAYVRPLGLTEQEKQDLLAFLESLSDPSFLSNPDFQP